ncbi:class I SAM-dependent methyltransferase [Candidatus Bathycorpusculum sp.]|uniref:class I SAM-dependent methyltransferase n=1 Tax=Candidatus Bathycorpusculum sp. TaxID=2994959 RepID=UPI00281CD56B|nr:class I SAM-dependent methyltransferase [Candidatus Termitimicrobium sp.]MCL2685035.1 class I SAM-dependent methyltransferase [Candidatus Termitimicrobium sp.]
MDSCEEYNLNCRILLHDRFSTNGTNWFNWIFDLMDVRAGHRVLELGAGNGEMWVKNAERVPFGVSVLVSDVSEDFLNQARERINNQTSQYSFKVIDIQNITCSAGFFDRILANTMLYHSDNVEAALSEVVRVLKPEGYFYATTSGLDHLQELKELVLEFDSDVVFPLNGANKKFCLENGETILQPFFKNIECVKYINSLRINNADYLYEFITSFKKDKNYNIKPIIENPTTFLNYLKSKIKNTYIEVTKSSCLFINSNT